MSGVHWPRSGVAETAGSADAGCVDVDLLVIADCPHRETAESVLRTALDDVGLGRVPIRVTVVETQRDAENRHFPGSPTILIDGRDPFAQTGAPPALACRVYRDNAASPDLGELRQALKRAAAEGVAP